jgi:hypothetical protein
MGPKYGSIPSSWLSITGVMGAHANLALLDEVKKRGIDPNDRVQVEQAWKELNERNKARAEELQARSAERKAEAEKDAAEREEIIRSTPGLANKLKKGHNIP